MYVSSDRDDPRLYKNALLAGNIHWICGEAEKNDINCEAKIRYNMGKQRCRVSMQTSGRLKVEFEQPIRAIATGQSVVFYKGEEVLGGGEIQKIIS